MTTDVTLYTARTLDDTMTLGKVLAQSGYFADSREAAQAVVKILAGQELGFGPIASMTGVNIIKGKVTLSANLIASAIKRSGRYNYRVVTLTDEACRIDFYEAGERIGTSEFTMQNAKDAGLATGDNWRKFSRNMLFARAISNGAKWYCPDLSGGPIYTPEELGATVDGETGEVIDQPARTVTIERPAAAPWGLRDDAESAMEAPHLQSPTRPLAPRAPAQPKPSAGPTWTPEPDPNGFDDLPSASAERNGGNGKAPPASAHDPAAPWDDNRKAEAVRWAMRRYPEVYNHVKPWQLSLDHLLEKAASEGMDAAQIAQAWKDKCAGKQDELDAKKLQATLDAQAAGDELPVFESR